MIGRHLPVHFIPSSSDLRAMIDNAMAKCDRDMARHRAKSFRFDGSSMRMDDLMAAKKEDPELWAWAQAAAIGDKRDGFERIA